MSNTAVGFPCPKCGHDVAEVRDNLRTIDGLGFLVGHGLYCLRCEHYWHVFLHEDHHAEA